MLQILKKLVFQLVFVACLPSYVFLVLARRCFHWVAQQAFAPSYPRPKNYASTYVLVTGAGSGIGLQTVKELASNLRCKVFCGVLNDREKALIENLSKQHKEWTLIPLMVDVTDQTQIDAAYDQVKDQVGDDGLFALFNNAGIFLGGPVECMPMKDFDKVMDVNLYGQVRMTQAFMPLLRAYGPGARILFTTSILGRFSVFYGGAYGASKHALEAVVESFRREVASLKMHVVAIEPGYVKTGIVTSANKQLKDTYVSYSPACQKTYASFMLHVDAITQNAFDEAPSVPVDVAKTVLKALTTPKPYARYSVGRDAWMFIHVFRPLNEYVFDLLERWTLSWKFFSKSR